MVVFQAFSTAAMLEAAQSWRGGLTANYCPNASSFPRANEGSLLDFGTCRCVMGGVPQSQFASSSIATYMQSRGKCESQRIHASARRREATFASSRTSVPYSTGSVRCRAARWGSGTVPSAAHATTIEMQEKEKMMRVKLATSSLAYCSSLLVPRSSFARSHDL